MNQEKIMKAKMITAIIVAFVSVFSIFVFAALYVDQSQKNRLEYIGQFEKNILNAAEEIDKYYEKNTDYDLHYNMIISDVGAARAMIFMVDEYTDKQKIINEIHYCLIKYPEQMKEKLPEASQAFHDIANHLDKGFEEVQNITDTIDRLGN